MHIRTTVHGIICPKCEDIIFSVATHDFHCCNCGLIFCDGGFDYLRMGFNREMTKDEKYSMKDIKGVTFKVKETKEQLYNLWKSSPIRGELKTGVIRSKDRTKIFDILYIK